MAAGVSSHKETTSPSLAKTEQQREQYPPEAGCLLIWGPLSLQKANESSEPSHRVHSPTRQIRENKMARLWNSNSRGSISTSLLHLTSLERSMRDHCLNQRMSQKDNCSFTEGLPEENKLSLIPCSDWISVIAIFKGNRESYLPIYIGVQRLKESTLQFFLFQILLLYSL